MLTHDLPAVVDRRLRRPPDHPAHQALFFDDIAGGQAGSCPRNELRCLSPFVVSDAFGLTTLAPLLRLFVEPQAELDRLTAHLCRMG